MRKEIYYFVDDIGLPFVINDIKRVAEHYEKVYLFSIEKLENKAILPSNVVVLEEFIDWSRFKPASILATNFFPIIGIYFSESLALKKILSPKKAFAVLASNIFKAEEILNHIKDWGESPFYSFWFYDCIYLAWLKKRKKIKAAFSRAHSGDLYEDHASLRNNILFRHFQLKHLDGVFPVSDSGTKYFQAKYPYAGSKFKTIFLGSTDPEVLNPFSNERFVIVSCSNFRHHKRIHKIAEMLLNIDFPVTWYHFGDENLDGNDPKTPEYIHQKHELKQKENIDFQAMGHTSNEKIFEFYRDNPVNLFVSLSAAEGIPVSMMEAISFGIPVLSTDVGGCREIVNEQTGILIPLKTGLHEVAVILREFKYSKKNAPDFRYMVRNFWEKHFNASINYKIFIKKLESIKLF